MIRLGPGKVNYRPTWAEVDLKAIRYNLNQIRRLVGARVAVMAVVKANAYGHGLVEVSGALQSEGVEYLGVATIDEALRLRERRINTPILLLGSVLEEEAQIAIKNDVTLTLCSCELLKIIAKICSKESKKAKVHIKIDTGMGRIGIWHEEALDFIGKVLNEKSVDVEGVYTHFSSAGRDDFFTQYQIDSFKNLIERIENNGIEIKYKHAANSIATVDLKTAHLNLVRPGIIIYGMYPKRGFEKLVKLKPALSLKTRIIYLKNTPEGRSISYGRTYITQKHTKIATLPIGYADGYGRILSNKAEVLVRGKRAPVVGKVTMDQTMLDVGHVRGVSLGDEVVLIGKQGFDEIMTEKLARLAGTIAYEIICSISNRVPRVYK
jgi:alanine racemase